MKLTKASLIATASPVQTRDLGAWLTSVRQEAARLGRRPASFHSLELSELMEDEVAGHGFSIRESDPDFDAFNLRVEDDPEDDDERGCTVDQPYWTTTGDEPVVFDQYELADMERSAGGIVPNDTETERNPWDEPVLDLEHADKWGEFHHYCGRAAQQRSLRTEAIVSWVLAQTDVGLLKRMQVACAMQTGAASTPVPVSTAGPTSGSPSSRRPSSSSRSRSAFRH